MSKRYPGGILRKTPQNPTQTSAQGIWDMASVTQAVKENNWPIAGVPDPISKSLRFRSSASAYLNRTPASAGNRKTWTWSAWAKRSNPSANGTLFAARTGSGATYFVVSFQSAGDFRIESNLETAYPLYKTNALFRDPSAWYHIVVTLDMTQATSTDRLKVWVNNVLQTTASYNVPAQNTDLAVNSTETHLMGQQASGNYFDGYLTEINFIDGQALTPSSFGGTNDQTGVWQPIAYTGTYGTNGFYLPFSDTTSTSTLGTDFSGNNNNWTTNNISLTSGATYDSMVDVPTQWIPYNTAGDTGALYRGNYSVWNPLQTTATITDGNLQASCATGAYRPAFGTIGVSSGKWYWEAVLTATSGTYRGCIGIAKAPISTTTYLGAAAFSTSYAYDASSGNKLNNGTGSAYGATYTTNDVIGVALDMDAGTLTFYKNNTSQGTAFTGLTGEFFAAVSQQGNTDTNTYVINFGQRPFSYTPPAGFNTLCTTNLSTPTIGATATTTANKYFDATTYTGNGSTQSITNSGSMQPDFVWLKTRSTVQNHSLIDAVRGNTKILYSDLTNAEGTFSGVLDSFNSNGFTLGSSASVNQNGTTFVGWQWRASNASGVTNTAGSITSTVSANTTAGFSIVTYTGNSTSGATVGHGLGVAPSMIIAKGRTNVDNWRVYHASLGNTGVLILNATNAFVTNSSFWNNTSPSSTVVTLGNDASVNQSSNTFVLYCFAEVAGYSKFGSYTGNGSTSGPFIYLGFRPRYILLKRTDVAGDWVVIDTARGTYNTNTPYLNPNLSSAENGLTGYWDLLSNGFRVTTTDTNWNNNGSTYIYATFAESPFKYALAR